MPNPINSTSRVTKKDTGICIVFASLSTFIGLRTANNPNINSRLHKLLPMAFPKIKSPAPLLADVIVTINSGAEVPKRYYC